jgi:hypothetical protein
MKGTNLIIVVCISVILVNLTFTSSGAGVAFESLVGAWLFDEGMGNIARDSSVNGLDGTIEGRPDWVDGAFGKALEFDGTEVAVVIPSLGKMKKEEGSVVLWVNPDFEVGDGRTYSQISVGGHFSDNLGAKDEKCHQIFKYTNNSWFFRVGHDINGIGASQFVTPEDIIPKGQWTHVAMTWKKGGESVVYINGSRIGILSADTETMTSWRQEKIFIGLGRKNDRHRGLIDEVGLFNKVLSEGQIRRIMASGIDRALAAVSPADKLSATWASIKGQY